MTRHGRDPTGERDALTIFYLVLGLTLAGLLIVAVYLWP